MDHKLAHLYAERIIAACLLANTTIAAALVLSPLFTLSTKHMVAMCAVLLASTAIYVVALFVKRHGKAYLRIDAKENADKEQKRAAEKHFAPVFFINEFHAAAYVTAAIILCACTFFEKENLPHPLLIQLAKCVTACFLVCIWYAHVAPRVTVIIKSALRTRPSSTIGGYENDLAKGVQEQVAQLAGH